MTESLSYLATAWALYAIALALERPTVLRQFAVLAAIGAALLTRTSSGSSTSPGSVRSPCLWLLAPATRPRSRGDLVRFWPTALPVALGALAFVAGSPPDARPRTRSAPTGSSGAATTRSR